MAALEIRDLSVRYQPSTGIVEALSNVNLGMGSGDFTVAIGASGCGKTTLLSVIAGFLAPSQGAILLDGQPVMGPGADRGVVFQRHALMPWLTCSTTSPSASRCAASAGRSATQLRARSSGSSA